MRLMIFSNAPFAGTGYGVQSGLLGPRLRDAGHEVHFLAYWGLAGSRLFYEGMPVYPQSRHPASQDVMVPLAAKLELDAIIANTDAWVIETQRFEPTKLAYIPWFPIDCWPMDDPNARGVAGPGPKVTYPVATSDHAAAMARDRGITDMRTIHYMLDTEVYCPGDKREARGFWGVPQDAFVVGMVAMNKTSAAVDRKRFDEQLTAFARFREKHDDAVIYLHSDMVAADGVHIPAIATARGVPKDALMASDGLLLQVGAHVQDMANLYRCFDVLLGVTGGEGAGMPLLEAAGVGTPTISGEWTAMPEYAKSGWTVKADEAQPQMNGGRVNWMTPRIEAIVDRLEQAYSASASERKALAEKAIAGAAEHDADRVVTEKWLPALEEVAERIADLDRVTTVKMPELSPPKVEVPA